MKPTVTTINGKTRVVKNLGWIRRNWKNIERLEWKTYGKTLPGPTKTDRFMDDGEFWAIMRDGSVYKTPYACFSVWRNFIRRPVFYGLPCSIDGRETVVSRDTEFGLFQEVL